MQFDPERHRRRSTRLPTYDYASGGPYFLTICTFGRERIFGEVVEDAVVLTPCGEIAQKEWERSAELRPGLVLDMYVVMPNHLHCVVALLEWGVAGEGGPVGAYSCAPVHSDLRRPPRSLSSFVAQFKATTTRRINAHRGTTGSRVWQRNDYEHIVRDDEDLSRIRDYIANNPQRWSEDEYYTS